MSEQLQRRSTDSLESRVSVLETKHNFILESISNIGKALEKHMNDEDGTVKRFTDVISKMNDTVIINTETLRHLSTTFMTQTAATVKMTEKLETLDKRANIQDIAIAKIDSVGWTVSKILSIISSIILAGWAIFTWWVSK